MGGCQNCNCSAGDTKEAEVVCPPQGAQVSFDANGKCPCGKVKSECCRTADVQGSGPIEELCAPHGGKQVC